MATEGMLCSLYPNNAFCWYSVSDWPLGREGPKGKLFPPTGARTLRNWANTLRGLMGGFDPQCSEKLRAPKRPSNSVLVLTPQDDFHETLRTHEKAKC